MKIGLLGLSFNVGNKGCEALSYSFLEVLNKIAKKKNDVYEIYLIMTFPVKKSIKHFFNMKKVMLDYYPKKEYSNLRVRHILYKYISQKYIFINSIKKCDIVFDFTAGDSFTDIYGEKRFYDRTRLKEYVINKKIPLVLGSQTIGPFDGDEVRRYASKIIKSAFEVFVRDKMSYEYTKKISGRVPILTSDVAFELPYKKEVINNDKFKIGINISGLLWSGGYTKDNQFNLKVNYRKYCIKLIKTLLDDGKNEVYIISHATSRDMNFPDNDLIAAYDIKKIFPNVIITDVFKTAMDAKSFIASMDFFIGARMHATIAALSSGVPVVAFSYSRKFEGLFNSLKYKYVLNAKQLSTEEALKQSLEWIEAVGNIKKNTEESLKIIVDKNKYLEDKLEDVIYKIKSGGYD